MSKWLLFNANSVIVQLYQNKLMFKEMMMWFALYTTNTLCWIFIVLIHWANSPRIVMPPHSDKLSWFRANQSLPFLLSCCVHSGEVTNTSTRSFVLEASTVTITPPAWLVWNEGQWHLLYPNICNSSTFCFTRKRLKFIVNCFPWWYTWVCSFFS